MDSQQHRERPLLANARKVSARPTTMSSRDWDLNQPSSVEDGGFGAESQHERYQSIMQIFTDGPAGPGRRLPTVFSNNETMDSTAELSRVSESTSSVAERSKAMVISRTSIDEIRKDGRLMRRSTNRFLEASLEDRYQAYCLRESSGRARGLLGATIVTHVVLFVVFALRSRYERPDSGMNLWPREFDRAEEYLQWIYLAIAIPLILAPQRVGFIDLTPLRIQWKWLVSIALLMLMLGLQLWLMYQAVSSERRFGEEMILFIKPTEQCTAQIQDPFYGGLSFLQFIVARDDTIYVAFISTLCTLIIVIGGCLAITMQLDFPHVLMLTLTSGVTSWIIVIAYTVTLPDPHSINRVDGRSVASFASSNLSSMVLVIFASYFSDRTMRKTYVVVHCVDEENEELKDNLERAEAALAHQEDTPEERRAVKAVMEDNTTNEIIEDVKIPFSNIKLERKIYSGSMTEAILATYRGSKVVVKRVLRDRINEQNIAAFRAEIELMACLRHPNIVQFIGASWDTYANICMVVEYLPRGDVQSVLASNLILTWSDPLLKMAMDAAQGMLYLHASDPPVVHRDLKSRNLLCSTTFGCKVSDFARSRKFMEDELTTFAGTPFWLAPEVIRGEPYSEKADCYSFGVVLTEFESRKLPYHDYGRSGLKIMMSVAHRGLRPTIPPSCQPMRRNLMMDCMKEIPEDRPSMREILDRLQGECRRELAGREVEERSSAAGKLLLKRKAMFHRQDRVGALPMAESTLSIATSQASVAPPPQGTPSSVANLPAVSPSERLESRRS